MQNAELTHAKRRTKCCILQIEESLFVQNLISELRVFGLKSSVKSGFLPLKSGFLGGEKRRAKRQIERQRGTKRRFCA